MLNRFKGADGHRLLVEALKGQRTLTGDASAAEAFANAGTLRKVNAGDVLAEEDSERNSAFFIITGSFDARVKGAKIATRGAGELVGEMAAIDPTTRRTATLVATEDSVVVEVEEPDFSRIIDAHPTLWKQIALRLAQRLAQRNSLVRSVNDQIRIFIISSVEALSIAREVQNGLAHEDVLAVVWSNGVFQASHYPIEDLERELEDADFAVVVAHEDDISTSRETTQLAPRDNVVFELGFFMGRLGRTRTVLLEPKKARREDQVKLPSDLAGLTTLKYRSGPPDKLTALLGPVCTDIMKLIKKHGPKE